MISVTTTQLCPLALKQPNTASPRVGVGACPYDWIYKGTQCVIPRRCVIPRPLLQLIKASAHTIPTTSLTPTTFLSLRHLPKIPARTTDTLTHPSQPIGSECLPEPRVQAFMVCPACLPFPLSQWVDSWQLSRLRPFSDTQLSWCWLHAGDFSYNFSPHPPLHLYQRHLKVPYLFSKWANFLFSNC